jgi:hypothetical protein
MLPKFVGSLKMSGERRYTRSELKRYGVVLVVLLVALGIGATLTFAHYDVQLLVP